MLLSKNKNAILTIEKVSKPAKVLSRFILAALIISGLFLWPIVYSKAAISGDILITEIMYNPAGSNENREWLEIFNNTNQEINLAGWRFFEQNINHKLSGNLALPSQAYAVIVDDQNGFMSDYQNYTGLIIDSSFSLKNSGEDLALKDGDGNTIDKLTYDTNLGGNGNNKTLAKLNNNWQEGLINKGTPGQANDNQNQDEPTNTINTVALNSAAVGEIVINEFVYNPESGSEWVELFNKTNNDFDLNGWQIADGVQARLNLTGSILAHNFLTFDFNSSVLNNDGDIIILKNNQAEIIDTVSYGKWDDGDKTNNVDLLDGGYLSLARWPDGANTSNDKNDFQATTTPTKNQTNLITSLTSDDGQPNNQTTNNYSHQIFINEFLPDPDGTDSQSEWVELFNNEQEAVDLGDWQIDDDEDGSKPYTLPNGTIISGKGYLIFSTRITELALNNTNDNVRLIAPSSEIIKNVEYHDPPANQVYARQNNNNFAWSITHTPGAENIITTKEETTEPRVAGSQDLSKVLTSIKEIKNYPDGTKIKIRAVISAPSNLLGKGVAYLAGSGIKIYWRGHNLPQADMGDFTEVVGELDEYLNERQIKISRAQDFKILERHKAPQAKTISINQVSEDYEGSLITVSATVSQTSGQTFYLNDDKEKTIKIVIQDSTNIKKPPTPVGAKLTITGVLSQTKTGYRLLPRFNSDIQSTGYLPQTGSKATEVVSIFVLLIMLSNFKNFNQTIFFNKK